MKQPHLTNCPTCHGTGKVELEGALKETLSRFTSAKTRLSANDLHDEARGITKNATNNRLEKLRRLGLLERERAGRVWTYFRPAVQPEGAATAEPVATLANGSAAAPKPNSAKPLAGLRKADLKGRDGAAAESAKRSKAAAAKKGTAKK